jgi:hypothetical protein
MNLVGAASRFRVRSINIPSIRAPASAKESIDS